MNSLFDLPTDKDNSPGSAVYRSLFEAKADWQQDGHGITGPQRSVREDPVSPFPMNFTTDTFPKTFSDPQEKENCTPPSPDTSKTYVRATHFVGGKWTCYWKECT